VKDLEQLLRGVEGARWLRRPAGPLAVRRITTDSREVEPGDLFVAITGTHTDSHALLAEVAARGAAAVVVERAVELPDLPALRVIESRRALAELAAAWYDYPARELPIVGVTGTLGKTSVLAMLAAILERGGRRVGTIGSLGVRFAGELEETGHTVPPPLILQHALARMRDGGADLALMEVTTHALSQYRVHGLDFPFGIFTNLVPMEHMEYHGSFEEYLAVKVRYFDHLREGAPVVFPSGDRGVAAQVEARPVTGVSCGGDATAMLQVERLSMSAEGSKLLLRVREPLPCTDGEPVARQDFPLALRHLGRANINNAALAATAALCLGLEPPVIQAALGEFPPPRRRMEVIHRGRFSALDDTVGHPDSITACFEVAAQLTEGSIHVVFAVRGQRGVLVNRQSADALAIWSQQIPLRTLIITTSNGQAPKNRLVTSDERAAFLQGLRENGIGFEECTDLEEAIGMALERVADGDLLLLLGTAGMDRGAEILRNQLAREAESAA
jgi:UDP-N-acetylmuramoyl-L-alanyl-D-glutamate--2,6-diaminopimelate ligase